MRIIIFLLLLYFIGCKHSKNIPKGEYDDGYKGIKWGLNIDDIKSKLQDKALNESINDIHCEIYLIDNENVEDRKYLADNGFYRSKLPSEQEIKIIYKIRTSNYYSLIGYAFYDNIFAGVFIKLPMPILYEFKEMFSKISKTYGETKAFQDWGYKNALWKNKSVTISLDDYYGGEYANYPRLLGLTIFSNNITDSVSRRAEEEYKKLKKMQKEAEIKAREKIESVDPF